MSSAAKDPLRIGIYADLAREEQPRGIGLHVVNLVNALALADPASEFFLYYHQAPLRADPGISRIWPRDNVRLRPIRCPALVMKRYPRIWWNHLIPALVRRDQIDVFHGPNHFLPHASCPMVVTIHDLAFMKMDLYSAGLTALYREWTIDAMERAEVVISISESTKSDILETGIASDKIEVVYPGGSNEQVEETKNGEQAQTLRRELGITAPYVLFVGTIHPRKNVPFLVRAMAECKRRGLEHQLVLAGLPGPDSDAVEAAIEEGNLGPQVIRTGYIDDRGLHALYDGASVFVLPSRYEGFGMILHEAMSLGLPVIATDTSSISEVVGDAGILVNLDDDSGLADALESVLSNEDFRQDLIQRGLGQAARFSWPCCAEQTARLYRQVAGRSPQAPT